jgi:hypothetical protein
MEIQQGKGPWASPVNGIVPLGTTLTMVVGIDDKEGKITVLQFQNITVSKFYSFTASQFYSFTSSQFSIIIVIASK